MAFDAIANHRRASCHRTLALPGLGFSKAARDRPIMLPPHMRDLQDEDIFVYVFGFIWLVLFGMLMYSAFT